MSTQLALPPPAPAELVAAAARGAIEGNTRRSYGTAWRRWDRWCALSVVNNRMPFDPLQVAAFFLSMEGAGYQWGAVEIAYAAFVRGHRMAGHYWPPAGPAAHQLRDVMRALRKRMRRPERRVRPLTVKMLRVASKRLGHGVHAARDRAMLLLGFATGSRSAELVALNVVDWRAADHGERDRPVVLQVVDAKSNVARSVTVPWGRDPLSCPVRAMRLWLKVRGPVDAGAPLFCSMRGEQCEQALRLRADSLIRAVRRAVRFCRGENPRAFAAHSLRAGFVTTARAAGAEPWEIMAQTGHKTLAEILKYDRDAAHVGRSAALVLGL